MENGISYRQYIEQLLNGNPYAYNVGDVARYYLNGLGDRAQDWFRNLQIQRQLDRANRQPNPYDWMRQYPIGY